MTGVSKAVALGRFGPGGPVMSRLAAQWASPRPARLAIPAGTRVPVGASPELEAWIDLFEGLELEAADPAEAEFRAPGDVPGLGQLLEGSTGPSVVADLWSLLTASTVVVQQDELAYLASLTATASGVSPVYAFHPADWGLHPSDPAISVRLFRIEEAARRLGPGLMGLRPREPQPEDEEDRLDRAALPTAVTALASETLVAHMDPARLSQRSDWLVRMFVGLPIREAVDEAPDLRCFEAELAFVSTLPHLGLYWLFAHALLGNKASFERAFKATARSPDPWVKEARGVLRRWTQGRGAKLGPFSARDFELMREEARNEAPVEALEEPPGVSPSALYLARLKDGAATKGDDFIELFEHLGSGAEPGPGPWREHPEEALEEVLAGLARRRHLPLIDAALAEAARVPDHHRLAGRGRILARARLCDALSEFDMAMAAAGGTERFGPRRRDEVWRGVAHFRSAEAHARLASGAAAFAGEAEDWVRTASKVPWDALLARDTLETHELIVRFALSVPHTAVTAPLVVEMARAARAHRVIRAVPGLRRAVAGGIGTIADGSRHEVVQAVADLDEEAPSFLASMMSLLEAEWSDAGEEDEAQKFAYALACVVGPLIAADPDHLGARATAAALLGRFAVQLSPHRTPSPDLLESVRALVLGIHHGELRALVPTVAALSRLRPEVGPSAVEAHTRMAAAIEAAIDALA